MRTLRHLFWIAVVLAAAGLVGVSASVNYRFGFSLGDNLTDRQITGTAFLLMDMLKPALPIVLLLAWRGRNIVIGGAAALLLTMAVCWSLISATGFVAIGKQSAIAARIEKSPNYQRASQRHEIAMAELAVLQGVRPTPAIQGKIKALKAMPGANACKFVDGPVSRRTCGRVDELKIELAKAERRLVLEAMVAQAAKTMTRARLNADGQGTTIATIARWVGLEFRNSDIGSGLVVLRAVGLELGSTLGILLASFGWQMSRTRHGQARTSPGKPLKPGGSIVIDHEPITVLGALRLTNETGNAPLHGIERTSDGRFKLSQNKLAQAMDVSRRAVHTELAQLHQAGVIVMNATRAGTMVRMLAA